VNHAVFPDGHCAVGGDDRAVHRCLFTVTKQWCVFPSTLLRAVLSRRDIQIGR
jgi:hypothetical protein